MLKKFKYISYSILFVITITCSMIVSVFSALNTNVTNGLSLEYQADVAEVVAGTTLNMAIKNSSSVSTADSSVSSITFDYYTSAEQGVYTYLVNGVNVINGVEAQSIADSVNPINLYRVNKAVYILSSSKICAVGDMSQTFDNMTALEKIVFNNFDTRQVTSMFGMFRKCSSLTTLDLSSFVTDNVTNMQVMFNACTSLTSVNLSSFNTKNVTTMSSMFNNCPVLAGELDLSHFDTSNVDTFYCMFQNCYKLTSILMTNFNTEKVLAMNNMFAYCEALTSLDLSSFNTKNVTDMHSMFYGTKSLKKILVGSNWDTSSTTASGASRNTATMFTQSNISSVTLKTN